MKKVILLIALLTTLSACSLKTLNAVVPDGDSKLISNITYGSLNRQNLDIHTPNTLNTSAPVIVFFYGGRWQSGTKEEYQFVGQALAKRGFITVIPNYRLFPEAEFPVFIDDAASATTWVLNNIKQYGGDPSEVYVMGHSAGAHTAAMLITNKQYLDPRHKLAGFIGLSGPYDFKITDADIKLVFRKAPSYQDTQPISFIDGSEPPMLLLHGKKDKTLSTKNSQHMAEKTIKMGGQAELVIYKDMAHVGTLLALADAPFLYFAPVLDDIERFITCTAKKSRILPTCFANTNPKES